MSAPITAVTMWAAISPPSRGRSWVHPDTLARTRAKAQSKFLGGVGKSWEYWKEKGWTIERVFISAVQMAPKE